MLTRLTAICIIAAGLTGCEPRRPDIALPLGHPADASAQSGHPLPKASSLSPELVTATPQLGSLAQPASPPATRSGGGHTGHRP